MLKKHYRGLRADQVSTLFTPGSATAGSSFFRVLWCPSAADRPQFVVIASAKFHKSAVVRNRVRRSLFTAIESFYTRWTVGKRIAIVVKPAALTLSAREFRDALMDLFRRSGLI